MKYFNNNICISDLNYNNIKSKKARNVKLDNVASNSGCIVETGKKGDSRKF